MDGKNYTLTTGPKGEVTRTITHDSKVVESSVPFVLDGKPFATKTEDADGEHYMICASLQEIAAPLVSADENKIIFLEIVKDEGEWELYEISVLGDLPDSVESEDEGIFEINITSDPVTGGYLEGTFEVKFTVMDRGTVEIKKGRFKIKRIEDNVQFEYESE